MFVLRNFVFGEFFPPLGDQKHLDFFSFFGHKFEKNANFFFSKNLQTFELTKLKKENTACNGSLPF
jgi:hypothetical protein